ncbi:type II toxin-antitoxin system RelB/DinJ family antitoxin [Microcystis sp. M169S2]|uniref:type II toxin-antitoxin system RelB/DinJ family antitoxin n=1 Tax=Microcystis sp. M169S2 TaxID=2771157 RepID=UPI000CE9E1C3|nr:type II toxin-antitoxin system RelB/DinJ family antitoxin [Microcystis sp. M169S2]
MFEEIFQQLGSINAASITLLYQQVALNKGLPFSVNIPNKTTEETFKKTDREEEMVSCQSAEDMFDKLGIYIWH